MAIGLSLNPADIWRFLSESKRHSREEVANWLLGVAHDARQVVDTWVQLSRETRENLEESLKNDNGGVRVHIVSRFFANRAPLARVKGFYQSASGVLKDQADETLKQSFVEKAARLILTREKVVELYNELQDAQAAGPLRDSKDIVDKFVAFEGVVDLLNEQAAALEVMASNFRAST